MNMDNSLTYVVTICAVIFGADETILNVNLDKELRFERKSLMPLKDHMDMIFETDAIGLRRDYETARIDKALDVICVFKSFTICLERTDVEEYYKKMCDDVLDYLDNSIRAIRLFVEGPVRFKKLSIRMESQTVCVGKTNMSGKFSSILLIGEAIKTNTICKFHCDDEKIDELNSNISLIRFPLLNALLNDCHRYYDLSYHQDNFISITLLITCLEILFLENEKSIKKILAKRCSVFLYDSIDERLICYNKLKKTYKKRYDFVHDGDSLQITNEDILFLRDCVRKSLVKYLSFKCNKIDVIKELKTTIEKLDYLSDNE